MYLLLATFASFDAAANPLEINNLGCGTRPPPCIKILDTDFEIMPSDWYWSEFEALGGNLNYFRVEAYTNGEFRASIGEYTLDERWYSREESTERVQVYYLPAGPEAWIGLTTANPDTGVMLLVTGAEKPGF